MGRFEISIGAQFGGCPIKKRPPLVEGAQTAFSTELSRRTIPSGRRQQMTKSAQDGRRGFISLILSSKIAVKHLRIVWAFSAELLADYPKPLADGRSDSRI